MSVATVTPLPASTPIIPPKPPAPISATAEQMHVSIHEYLGLRWVGYDLVDSHASSLSLAEKVGYQIKLDTKKGFLYEESERLAFIGHEPLRVYLDKCSHVKWLTTTVQRVIAVIGSKGGVGKTPLAAYLAAMLQAISQFACLIIDANHNDGTTGERLGISRANHVLLLEALANLDVIKDYSTASMKLGRHKQTGLQALLSNPNTTNEQIRMDAFIAMFNLLKTIYHSIVADTGNGNEHAVNEGSLLEADVIIASALAEKPESIGTALTTLLAFYELGHHRKVRDALKVINATRAEHTKEKFLQMFKEAAAAIIEQRSKATQKPQEDEALADPAAMLETLGITEENIFLVPYSKYIAENGVVSLRPEDTGLPTLDAYADILKRVFEMQVPDAENKQAEIERRLAARNEPPTTATPSNQEMSEAEKQVIALLRKHLAPELQGVIFESVNGIFNEKKEEFHAQGYA